MTEEAITRTGVIGLGAMGLQMARHMVAKGFEVCGTDIDPAAMRRASAHGICLCGSAAEVGDCADIVRQLLVFARRDGLHLQSIDLNKSIARLEDFVRRSIGEQIVLGLWRDPSLPPPPAANPPVPDGDVVPPIGWGERLVVVTLGSTGTGR